MYREEDEIGNVIINFIIVKAKDKYEEYNS